MRNLLDGLFYLVRIGCQRGAPVTASGFSALAHRLRPCTFLRDGVRRSIRYRLFVMLREEVEREASPTAAIIDTQQA